MNEHVRKYWRWLGWNKEITGNHIGAFFYRDFGRQEREDQEKWLTQKEGVVDVNKDSTLNQ